MRRGFGHLLDSGIAVVAPVAGARRMAARAGLDALRKYEAGGHSRKTKGWPTQRTDADGANAYNPTLLRARAQDLVDNNKYADAGVRQMVANMIGDGIAPQFVGDKAKIAQAAWDRWAEAKVDGHDDFYGHQKVAGRGMIVGGETLTLWKPDGNGPDGRIEGLEGDYLDWSKTEDRPNRGRIVQGVEFDLSNERTAYWLFDRHPGGVALLSSYVSSPIAAKHVDHLFERRRFGQTRGASWLASVVLDLRDIADIEDAFRAQQKVQACLGLVLTPGEGNQASPLTSETPTADPKTGRLTETVSPGMIYRAQQGDTVTTITPSANGGAVEFIRQQLAAIAANMVPYHLMTGDVSQANYSSLRAAFLGFWALLDDWQQNVIIPQLVRPAVDRRMRRLALETGDSSFLEIGVNFALPSRRFVDPIKDLMAEIMEIRGGLKTLSRSLAERGINNDEQMREIARMNAIIDELGLALDSDPRRVTDSGVLQKAAGYIAPKDGAATKGD